MTPKAEKLSEAIDNLLGNNEAAAIGFDHGFSSDPPTPIEELRRQVARAIVSELGITPEMVESLRVHLGTEAHTKAASAFAVLLEVAGVQTEAP